MLRLEEQTNPIKIAICDDNAKEREFLYEMCKNIKDKLKIQMMVKKYHNGDDLMFDMEDPKIMDTVDIILLDIHMPGENGIEIARKLRELNFQGEIIFITKSDAHWRSGFGVRAFNYITKGEDIKKRFYDTLCEAIQEVKKRHDESVIFSSLNETRQIAISSISHFIVRNYLVTVYYDNTKFDFTSTISRIEDLLFDNENFIRINRSCIVSLSHIVAVKNGDVMMPNGDHLPISRRNMKAFNLAMKSRDYV